MLGVEPTPTIYTQLLSVEKALEISLSKLNPKEFNAPYVVVSIPAWVYKDQFQVKVFTDALTFALRKIFPTNKHTIVFFPQGTLVTPFSETNMEALKEFCKQQFGMIDLAEQTQGETDEET